MLDMLRVKIVREYDRANHKIWGRLHHPTIFKTYRKSQILHYLVKNVEKSQPNLKKFGLRLLELTPMGISSKSSSLCNFIAGSPKAEPQEIKFDRTKHLTNWRTYAIVVIRDKCGTGGIGRRA